MRGLWIARALPFPLDTGDRIYSARLIRAVADAGADLTVVGFAPAPASAVPENWPVRWRLVDGEPHGTARALFSTMPLVGAAHATSSYRRLVHELAQEQWDFVVFDQYGMGWAMDEFQSHRVSGKAPVLVHVAHDHEASVYKSLVRGFQGSIFKRAGIWQNWLKTRAIERHIARTVDLVTAITDEDAKLFAIDAPHTGSVVLTPGYVGAVSKRSSIGLEVPRNVIMVGNYKWVAKSENLRQFVAAADAAFYDAGITLHVVGSMAESLANELRQNTRATVLHGFVDDVGPHFANARIGVVPEEIGGGFKLKFLDYFFGRVAVASLTHATAGLPEEIRSAMICSPDIPSLVKAIVTQIDDTETLSNMQTNALAAAQTRYRWEDRGHDLLEAIRRVANVPVGRSAEPLHVPERAMS